MERGLHYMCWYRDMWNFHPSLPMKRMQMIEDIVDVEGTVLVWSCLGSGAIGLPYLYREAFDPVPPRMRFYGFLNDQEFCLECRKRGIKVYGVIWKAQMWEFPVELDGKNASLLAFNVPLGRGKKSWLGLRELSRHQYPGMFRPMDDFFPNGVTNSAGRRVRDFLRECKTETLEGHDIFSGWLMVTGHEHKCYTPCGNNPVYMTYLKRNAEIMVDAGVSGIFVDEPDTQQIAMDLGGGCFCRDCIAGFREYLKMHPDPRARHVPLDRFHYRRFLLGRGYTDDDLKDARRRWKVPFYKSFARFNQMGMIRNFADLSAHIKAYGKRKNTALAISGNHYDCHPKFAGIRKYADMIGGEKHAPRLRQDGWYRFAHAFCGGKPSCFIEAPSPHIMEMLEDIKDGVHDKYILFMLEAHAQGITMSIPYGGWLGNRVRDAFWPDMRLAKRMGRWLRKHERLFRGKWRTHTAVIYDHECAWEQMTFHQGEYKRFDRLVQYLCDRHRLFEVLYVGRDDPLTAARLSRFRQILLPDAIRLPESALAVIEQWQNRHGRRLIIGRAPKPWRGEKKCKSPTDPQILRWLRRDPELVESNGPNDVGFQLHRLRGGYALHLTNYRHDPATHRIRKVRCMRFRLGFQPAKATVHAFPEADTKAILQKDKLTVRDLSIHTIVVLR